MSHWSAFWEAHAQATGDAEPQIQVMRTWHKQPIPPPVFEQIVAWLLDVLQLEQDHRCLDLCCGNGVLTHQLAARCRDVVAVDFTADLLSRVDVQRFPHIQTMLADVRACDFPTASFDRILLYAGLQYLTERETIELMHALRRWLRPSGRIVIGDIPDRDRLWHFHDTEERRSDYFRREREGRPIIGTWFDRGWLFYLANHAGFVDVRVMDQPEHFPFQHFRFDLVLA